MKIGISYNTSSEVARRLAERVFESLQGRKADAVYVENAPHGSDAMSAEEAAKGGIDLLITLGGDGTVLRAMRWFAGPVLAVNAGGLGFLTEASGETTEQSLERLLVGDYLVDARMKIMAMKCQVRLPDAVNEVVVHTDQVGKMREFEVSIRDERITRVRADGIMVATPTGSTSYALSAGGPIIHPNMDAMVMVYMSPFSLTAKPIVLPGDSLIEIKCAKKGCMLVIDGQESIDVRPGEGVDISRSETRARFVRFKPLFLTKLNRRLLQE